MVAIYKLNRAEIVLACKEYLSQTVSFQTGEHIVLFESQSQSLNDIDDLVVSFTEQIETYRG